METEDILSLHNLGGDFAALYDFVNAGGSCAAVALGPAERAHVATHLNRFLLYVVPDSPTQNMMYERIVGFCPDARVLDAKDDLLIYRKAFQHSRITARLKVLADMARGNIGCVITTPQALAELYPSPQRLLDSIIKIKKGETRDLMELTDKLTEIGYVREARAEEKSTFSLAGDTLVVFPPDADLPVRISFWGDEVDGIKLYDPESMMTVAEKEELEIYPCNDLLLTEKEWNSAIAKARRDSAKGKAKSGERRESILSDLETSGRRDQGGQWLLPYYKETRARLTEYLPDNCVIALEEDSLIKEKLNLYKEEHLRRVQTLAEDGEAMPAHAKILADAEEIREMIRPYPKAGFYSITSTAGLFSPERIFKLRCSPLPDYTLNYKTLYADLKNFRNAGFNVVLCMGDARTARTITDSLNGEDILCHYEEKPSDGAAIHVTPIVLPHGVCYPGCRLAVIGRDDIIRRSGGKVTARTRSAFSVPKLGDYVVHDVHGIGRCVGIKRMAIRDSERDYIAIEYAGGAMLYVPIDQTERLSRYSGSEGAPRLSKLGGKDFEKLKESVKKSLRAMATDLVKLYAERMQVKGYKYSPDTSLQTEFEQSFEYEDTPDQTRATQEIKADMERGIVMDRLLCGDVGYGKTEVALRAVFKTVTDGKSAVILAPTTVLARQHYNTASARFAPYGLKVELLTRFQSREEVQASLERLSTGKSLIAVATHRILGKDVHFHDLGLLVLDEEQRFGVEQKEKLKLVKKNVNVLTLSATPIPRTLNMALTGIRDISVLETPPKNRLPVQTYVTELTDALLKDAISREIARGGQTYVLFNRVQGIEKMADRIATLVPEAKIVVGHGQMDAVTLEDALRAFYNRQANVMVCTTIIENGIDVEGANTLIVCEADKLGLAQLYQLRGRVGRRDRMAYAYFTTNPSHVVTSDAVKRLKSLMDYTELGSGFKIAMRDLEIRGAGNILGREQHGHIEKVGYDMYCKLLAECVDELRGVKSSDVEAEVSIEADAYLDSRYIADVDDKLKVYRQISELTSRQEADELLKKLEGTYGTAPAELKNLVTTGLIRNLACKVGVEKVALAPRSGSLTFADGRIYRDEGYLEAISAFSDAVSVTAEDKPRLVFDKFAGGVEKKMQLTEEILTKIYKLTRKNN